MIQILIIDDDRHMRAACARSLLRAGWTAVEAESGNEGIQLLRGGVKKIDVVLLDQLMPGITGMETLAQIRVLDPNLPVVIMTGFTTEESVLDLKKQGAFDCLAKPFTPEQLRTVISRAIARNT